MAKQFHTLDQFKDWKSTYQIFSTPEGQAVLQDLMEYCHFLDDDFPTDPYVRAARDGRRQVFLRIVKNLGLSVDELLNTYRGRWVKPTELKNESEDILSE